MKKSKSGNSGFKKNHFWVLLGLVPLFVLIAVVMIDSEVGEAIAKGEDVYKKAETEIGGKTSVKPDALVAKFEKTVEVVKEKQGTLWKENWESQKPLFTWPRSERIKNYIAGKDLKFGARIPDDDFVYDDFKNREVYRAEFTNAQLPPQTPPGMADTVHPTQFLGGWEKVLRHVNVWSERQLTSDQIWLMMEDIWVQRAMLDAVRSVNAQVGEFVPVEPKGEPLHRTFRNRVWEVELQVKTEGTRQVLTGKLTNLTDRLQLMGQGNTMKLNVWLSKGANVQPFLFEIGGEVVPGKGALKPDGSPDNVREIVRHNDHTIDATLEVSEIVKVEQVFDLRTVPVRRIEAMELGKRDSRHAGSQLFPLRPDPAPAVPAGGVPGDPAGMPPEPAFRPVDDPGMGIAGQNPKSGGGPVATVLDGNKKRYISVSEQVRRMPVAIVVVVDQAYLQDVLLAFANSPLRFQITQVIWKRFRGNLETGPNTGLPGSPQEPEVIASGQGFYGSEFRDDYEGRPLAIQPGGLRNPGFPGTAGFPGAGGFPFESPLMGGGGRLSTVSDAQITAGLIELSVYGIVSLYEKYSTEPPPPEPGKEPTGTPPEAPAPTPGATPPAATPGPTTPAPTPTPAPKAPLPPPASQSGAKPRRRAR